MYYYLFTHFYNYLLNVITLSDFFPIIRFIKLQRKTYLLFNYSFMKARKLNTDEYKHTQTNKHERRPTSTRVDFMTPLLYEDVQYKIAQRLELTSVIKTERGRDCGDSGAELQ